MGPRITLPLALAATAALALSGCGQAQSTPTDPMTSSTPPAATTAAEAQSISGIVVVDPEKGGGLAITGIDPATGATTVIADYPGELDAHRPHPREFSAFPAQVDQLFTSDFTRMATTDYAPSGRVRSSGWYEAGTGYHDVTGTMARPTSSSEPGVVYSPGVYDGQDNYYFSAATLQADGDRGDIQEMFMIPTGQDPTQVTSLGPPELNGSSTGIRDFRVSAAGDLDFCAAKCPWSQTDPRTGTGGPVADSITDTRYVTLNENATAILIGTATPADPGTGTPATEELFTAEAGQTVSSPVVSPNGDQVAFLLTDTGSSHPRLYLLPIDGTQPPQQLQTHDLDQDARLADWQ